MARVRSPNYPAISLPDAIERARKVYMKEHTHKAAPEVVAKAMGYGGLNGGSLTTISALKKYGLLEEVGKDLKISKDALLILVDPKDSTERAHAIRRAAFLPVLFADLHEEYGPTLPSDENLRAFLQKRSFAPSAVDVPIRAYRETIALVNEYESLYTGASDDIDQIKEEPVTPQPAVGTSNATFAPLQAQGAGFNSAGVFGPGIEVASYPVAKDCVIRLRATGPLTAAGVENLIKQLQLGLDIGLYPDGNKTN